ncbi:MAG: cupin-like domain-containing protein [Myxococcota bacterium]
MSEPAGHTSELPDEWLVWLAGSLLEDTPIDRITAVLVERGLTAERATTEIASLQASPSYRASRAALRPRVLAQRLRQAHLRLGDRAILRRPGLSAEAFLSEHIAAQVPVVLPDLTHDWPAARWTWSGLAHEHGHLRLQACSGRTSVDTPDDRWRELSVELSFAELIERITTPGVGNDLYVVANNLAMEGPLIGLRDDFRPVPGILAANRLDQTAAWIGGAGAHTPLHHDTSDILLCPFLGAKRVWLVPPEEIEVTLEADRFWGPSVDLDDSDLAVRETVVQPGEMLLIPSGWWHQVTALEASLTVTFAGMRHLNGYKWYQPGFAETPGG